MARSIWKKSLVTSVAWAGLAWGQQPASSRAPSTPAATSEQTLITVQETGKAAQKCRVLKTWKTAEGTQAYQVQALDSGEMMTIVESGPATNLPGARPGTVRQAMATRIFHWGRNRVPPEGTPTPPVEYVQSTPAPRMSTTQLSSTAPAGVTVQGATPPQTPTSTTSTQPQTAATSAPLPVIVTPKSPTVTQWDTNRATAQTTLPTIKSAPSPYAMIGSSTSTPAPAKTASRTNKSNDDQLVQVVPPSTSSKDTLVPLPKIVDLPPASPAPAVSGANMDKTPPASQAADWRKSWGKADVHASEAHKLDNLQVETNKPTPKVELPYADSKRPDPLRSPDEYRNLPLEKNPNVPKLDLPKVAESKTKNNGTSGMSSNASSLPKSPAPEMTPAKSSDYSQMAKPSVTVIQPPEVKLPDMPARAVHAPAMSVPAVSTPIKQAPAMLPPVMEAPAIQSSTSQRPALQQGPVPLGAQSVLGADSANIGPVRYVPVPIVTVPDVQRPSMPPTPRIPQPPNPFPSANNGNAFVMPGSKALGPDPTTTDPGQVNAFTSLPSAEATARGTNAFGSMETGPMGPMAQPSQNAMYRPMAPAAYAGISQPPAPTGYIGLAQAQGLSNGSYQLNQGVQAAGFQRPQEMMGQSSQQMILVLRDSLYPSQREWAADSIASLDWRSNPQAVQALLTAARQDPAATVRAACVRSLGKMHADAVPIVNAIQALKADTDPRVRAEVEQTLATLSLCRSASWK